MPNLVSPGVLIQERDLSAPQVAPSLQNVAAIVGPFSTGPVDTITSITSENALVNTFGKPNDSNYETWLMASSYLAYGGTLSVVRPSSGVGTSTANVNAVTTSAVISSGSTTISASPLLIQNQSIYESNYLNASNTWHFAARYAGSLGNSVGVSIVDHGPDSILSVGNGFTGTFTAGQSVGSGNTTGVVYSYDSTNKLVTVFSTGTAAFTPGLTIGAGATVSSVSDWYSSSTNYAIPPYTKGDGTTIAGTTWSGIAARPGTSIFTNGKGGKNDELHVVVYDVDGSITGVPNTILEKYVGISKANDAKLPQGDLNYIANVLTTKSSYVYWGKHIQNGFNPTTFAPVTSTNLGSNSSTNFNIIGNVQYDLTGGFDNQLPTVGELNAAYNLFSSVEAVSVDYLLPGASYGTQADTVSKAANLISLAESRKDCIAFVSPWNGGILGVSSSDTQTTNIIAFFNQLQSSSYAVFDSGIKYIYDRYNDKYRYIGCAGDVAGLLASASINQQPWFSPAGYTRGQIKNAIKLAFTPTKAQRDSLYLARVNPIASFPGQGIVLFGDKTALSSPSAFDRINVRKLFLTLEKTIQQAANQQLFELNDDFTRNSFKGFVEPYLRDVQSKRGITDFLVVCDTTNNTPDVIDRNEFRADIYIKPTRSINYIYLTFVATRTGVSFQQVVGTV